MNLRLLLGLVFCGSLALAFVLSRDGHTPDTAPVGVARDHDAPSALMAGSRTTPAPHEAKPMAHRPPDAVPLRSLSVSSSLPSASNAANATAARTQNDRGQRDTEDSASRVARPPLPSDRPDAAEPVTALPVTAPLPNPSTGLAAPPTAARAIEVAVEVPPGEEVPLVLVPVDQADGFTPQDLAFIGAEADRFVVEASQGGTVPQPDTSRWQSARQQSDELFRTWYGTAAYMAMQGRRHFEAQPPQPPAP